MATSLSARFALTLDWSYIDTDAASGRTVKDANQIQYDKTLAQGTGLDQSDIIWADTRQVLDANNDDIDLAGVLTNSFGTTLTFVKVKGIAVVNLETTAGYNLIIGGGSNTFSSWLGAAGDTVTVGPNGAFMLMNPSAAAYAVTAGTGDILRLTGSGGDIDYDILIVGTTA